MNASQPGPAYTLAEVVRHARAHSPFYRAMYAGLPENPVLAALPVLDSVAFWRANGVETNTVLTGPLTDGIVFKSGGTTGNPKFSPYTRAEWEVKTGLMGLAMARAGLEPGDRVANLFRGGDLYASFLSVGTGMLRSPCPIVEYPIGDLIGIETILRDLEVHRITVLASYPAELLKMAEHLLHLERRPDLPVRLILYAGESLFPDQREFLVRAFPRARIASMGYGSVDAAMIGYADETCGADEFRPFDEHVLMEILDEENGRAIEETGKPGRVVVTNLTRLLMPVIRYPAGDRAAWIDPPGARRRFRLCGRSEEGARVGVTTLYIADVRQVLVGVEGLIDFQMLITHEERRDRLTLRLAVFTPARDLKREEEIAARLVATRPELRHALENGEILPLAFEWVHESELERVARTGKLRRVVDRRQ